MNSFYVYIYLDPRSPGRYYYNGMNNSFLFKPFYVGKGKGDRYRKHLTLSKSEKKFNKHKSGTIDSLLREGHNLLDYIVILERFETEDEAFAFEELCIKSIGRHDLKLGPLTNQTNGGRGSFDRGIYNISVRKPSLRKKYNMSAEQKERLSNLRSIEIKQIDKNTKQILNVWKNAKTAAAALNICIGAIHAVVSETQPAKTAGSFMWEYVCKPNKKYINGLEYVDKTGECSPAARKVTAHNILTDEKIQITGITKFCKQQNIILRKFRDSIKTKKPQKGWLLISYDS